jgi:hypothetical protein
MYIPRSRHMQECVCDFNILSMQNAGNCMGEWGWLVALVLFCAGAKNAIF